MLWDQLKTHSLKKWRRRYGARFSRYIPLCCVGRGMWNGECVCAVLCCVVFVLCGMVIEFVLC